MTQKHIKLAHEISTEMPQLWTRLLAYYDGAESDWSRLPRARYQKGNFAYRYHLVYPAWALFYAAHENAQLSTTLRPTFDAIYRKLIARPCWDYWHSEMGETSGAIAGRNLTYAGRLASFVGLYIERYGEPPADLIEVDGVRLSYHELSESLWGEMVRSKSCGVSCYEHQSMVMCNASLMINNLLHDRLYGTSYATANERWLQNVERNLLTHAERGPMFYYGTLSHSPEPNRDKTSLGMDAWGLALMSVVAPDFVTSLVEGWTGNVRSEGNRAWIPIESKHEDIELSSPELASAWAYVLFRELGRPGVADLLENFLKERAMRGFAAEPYVLGLFLLGYSLKAGGLRQWLAGAHGGGQHG